MKKHNPKKKKKIASQNDDRSDYLNSLRDYILAMHKCNAASRNHANIPAPTSKHYWSSVIFTALTARAYSLCSILPNNPYSKSKIDNWDNASIAILARAVFESCLTFHYICADECSDDEWQCRINLFHLHDCNRRMRLFEHDKTQYSDFIDAHSSIKKTLSENLFFMSLNEKRRNELLKSKTPFLSTLLEMSVKFGITEQEFNYIYPLMSSHVHCLPFSFYRTGTGEDERGRGLYSKVEKDYAMLYTTFTTENISRAADNYISFWKK